jgi:hypothetical protein
VQLRRRGQAGTPNEEPCEPPAREWRAALQSHPIEGPEQEAGVPTDWEQAKDECTDEDEEDEDGEEDEEDDEEDDVSAAGVAPAVALMSAGSSACNSDIR